MSFTRFSSENIVRQTSKITTSTWSNNTNALTTVFTSSTEADTIDGATSFVIDSDNASYTFVLRAISPPIWDVV